MPTEYPTAPTIIQPHPQQGRPHLDARHLHRPGALSLATGKNYQILGAQIFMVSREIVLTTISKTGGFFL